MKTFLFLLLATLAIRLGFPPFDFAPMTIVGWAMMTAYIISPQRTTIRVLQTAWLTGSLWNASMVFYIGFPHWATAIGTVVLAVIWGFLWLVWAGISRVACQRGVPTWIAIPITWVGLEWLQGRYILSGFLLNQQAIIFYKTPIFIQIAEFCGTYAVSFMVMLFAALVYEIWRQTGFKKVLYIASSVILFTGIAVWGNFRLNEVETIASQPIENTNTTQNSDFAVLGTNSKPETLQVALTQGNVPCQIEMTPELIQKSFDVYNLITFRVLHTSPRPEVVVWPECMFRYPLWEIGNVEPVPDENYPKSKEEYLKDVQQYVLRSQQEVGRWSKVFDTYFITGIDRAVLSGKDIFRYNEVVCVNSYGKITSRYDKQHLVPFGEYIPFANTFEFIKQITPVGSGTQPGEKATVLTVTQDNVAKAGQTTWTFLPSVCYENALPHVIREQLLEINSPIDALLNVSNDGWFMGCFEAELRLAQSVFRSVESRKNHLISSNGGFSAHITPSGRIVQCGERIGSQNFWIRFGGPVQDQSICVALDRNPYRNFVTCYICHGDVFAIACAILSVIFLFVPLYISKFIVNKFPGESPVNSVQSAK